MPFAWPAPSPPLPPDDSYSSPPEPPSPLTFSARNPDLRSDLQPPRSPPLPRPPTAAATAAAHGPSFFHDEANTAGITDRCELISRIKAGENPTWIPASQNSPAYRPDERYCANHSPSAAPRLTDEHPDRPKSALHQGVFTNDSRNRILPSSPPPAPPLLSLQTKQPYPHPSLTASPPPPFPNFGCTPAARPNPTRPPSLSSSFVLKTPTSPLVHSSNPDVDDVDDMRSSSSSSDPIDIANDPFALHSDRRRSMPPSSLSSLQFSPHSPTSSLARHQPFASTTACRRSEPWPPSPSLYSRQSRRLNSVTPGSDLPFGSFVGSYEESILNGRMSTTPSKPLTFLAQIGVLGLGKCKPSLRCPAHVSLPFPAYFYSVGDYDSPSPYVGQIDLSTSLALASAAKKAPPGVGGCYRIPQKGQLQIVIKNANKTAVKLYLVPYDLAGMEAGTKTFIRQKCYAAPGAGVPLPALSRRTVAGEKERESHRSEKDALRYLIHLHVVCPGRGRYYLFRSIRVVFANRVPDGKERLRNEVLWPEPKFTTWKPADGAMASVPATPASVSSTAARHRSRSLYGMAAALGAAETRRERREERREKEEYEKMEILGVGKGKEMRGLLATRLRELSTSSSSSGASSASSAMGAPSSSGAAAAVNAPEAERMDTAA